jgi:hypothetical protein
VDTFRERVAPWLASGHVKRLRTYHLTDAAEQRDPSTRALLGYGRSLLYLVSRSFEGGGEAALLGMERHFPRDVARMPGVRAFAAPSGHSAATTHAGFDDDDATMRGVITGMLARK